MRTITTLLFNDASEPSLFPILCTFQLLKIAYRRAERDKLLMESNHHVPLRASLVHYPRSKISLEVSTWHDDPRPGVRSRFCVRHQGPFPDLSPSEGMPCLWCRSGPVIRTRRSLQKSRTFESAFVQLLRECGSPVQRTLGGEVSLQPATGYPATVRSPTLLSRQAAMPTKLRVSNSRHSRSPATFDFYSRYFSALYSEH